jgi:hypothetical protein
MGFFNTILEKLGLNKNKPAAAAPAAAKPNANFAEKSKDDNLKGSAGMASSGSAPAAPKAITEVDVVKHLETLSKGKELNWKVSIVDLLKLLDIDSSREARNELAKELGCPADLMSDSAKMNTWLHKTVLKKIAENGGNIPQSLLD